MAYDRTLLGALITVVCSCSATNGHADRLASTVFAAEAGQYCSVSVSWLEAPSSSYAKIENLITFITEARTANPNLFATYIDFESERSVTLSSPGSCDESGATILETVKRVHDDDRIRLFGPFSPKVVTPPKRDAAVTSLTEALKSVGPKGQSVQSCSIALRVSPSVSAEDDRDLNYRIGMARDFYGLYILFSSQENDKIYLTFFQQCEHKMSMANAIIALTRLFTPTKVRILSIEEVNRGELKRAYGSVL